MKPFTVCRSAAWSDGGLEATAEASLACEIEESQSSHLLEELLATIDEEDEAAAGQATFERTPVRATVAAGHQYIVFTMGDSDYAVPIENVFWK